MKEVVLILVCYLLGSVPFSYLLGKICSGKDLRQTGSKNVGATNLYRLCGFKYAFSGFLADFLKGYFALFLIGGFLPQKEFFLLLGAVAVILGHVFPVFLKFKGGKGISTSAGVLFYLDFRIFLLSFVIFWVVFFFSRIVSLSSIFASLSLILFSVLFYLLDFLSFYKSAFFVFMGILLIIFHRGNIKRIFGKKESKIL